MVDIKIPYVDQIATGENINRLRLNANMSVKDIQTVFGFERPQAVYHWINGRSMPTVDNLVILATIFGVTLDELVITE